MMTGILTGKRSETVLPSVGVILTTFNGEKFIREQLDSLLNQNGVSLHVYVFDDKSSDKTIEILKGYSTAYFGTFTLNVNRVNSGGTGLNIFQGIQQIASHHDYMALADQDDIWLPGKLANAVEALTRDQSDLYFSNLLAWDGKDKIMGVVSKSAPLRPYDHLFAGGSAGCTYVMTRRFFEHLKQVLAATDLTGVRRISHDWIIYFIARHDGYRVTPSSEALIKYRIHPNSQYGGMSLGGLQALRRKFQMLQGGFLREQIANSMRFAREGTQDRAILLAYQSGPWKRLAVLARHRFSLVRNKGRFPLLVIASLFFY